MSRKTTIEEPMVPKEKNLQEVMRNSQIGMMKKPGSMQLAAMKPMSKTTFNKKKHHGKQVYLERIDPYDISLLEDQFKVSDRLDRQVKRDKQKLQAMLATQITNKKEQNSRTKLISKLIQD